MYQKIGLGFASEQFCDRGSDETKWLCVGNYCFWVIFVGLLYYSNTEYISI